jgi:RES domain-containing protein
MNGSRRERLKHSLACEACFRDKKLIEWVRARGEVGDCPWCGSKKVVVVRLTDLGDIFRQVASIYVQSEHGDPGDPIGFLLQQDFDVFSDLIENDSNVRDDLAVAILKAGLTKDDVDEPDYEGQFRDSAGSLLETWDEEVRDLLNGPNPGLVDIPEDERLFSVEARFHYALECLATTWRQGALLFRARLHAERDRSEWYRLDEMGAPESAPSQRANHEGQPVLYLATDKETCMAELRGWRGAVVAVATMETTRDLSLVDLTNLEPFESPFFIEELNWQLELRGLFRGIAEELSHPVLRNEEKTVYRVSQHFCDHVRAAGMHGVIYPSALGAGKNIVAFDIASAKAKDVHYYRITGVAFADEALSRDERPYEDFPWTS